ncbi:FAD-binding oxidoreductase [Streptomyces sp. R302]|uniref:FAD-binding protein n=1 Tax=unclassified Streptomyces TaxID=2593676 RepID=UPI00145D6A76|nr:MULTISPECIES: FAD-binding protein [unclassified Streptomyces]NML50495.1 FAD-binding oxidoreductase [Streptomyces sp. R301]NML79486.1 FAD-binding oxidoreductase [Streptomyces sp. R302]
MDDDFVPLTGAGRTAPSLALLARPRTAAEAAGAVLARGPRGAVARGRGRSCGDAAQNAGGTVLDVTALDRIRGLDEAAGLVVCEAGTELGALARALLPYGLHPRTGGGPWTAGGTVASGYGNGVEALELLGADGKSRTVRRGEPLFDATVGGLGLTGVVLAVTLALRSVETAYLRERVTRFRDVDALLAHWTAPGAVPEPYARARVEPAGRGRAVLTTAAPVPYAGLPRGHRARRTPLAPPPFPGAWPGGLGSGGLGSGGLRPLPGLAHARVLPAYGRGPRAGFVRYRCAVPEGREEALRGLLALLGDRRSPARGARHARVERVYADGAGPLAFPVRGWCLTVDVPAGARGLGRFLDVLDERVAAAGGRVCLAEDARLRPALLPVMYPRLDAFRGLRAALDPRSVFRSDLSRRLGL